jgi:cytochrome b561
VFVLGSVGKRTIALGLETLLQAEIGALGTLLGLVIAELAILVAFLSRDWIVVLMRASNGVQGDFFPFWYVAGLTTVALVFAGAGLILRLQATPLQSRMIATASIFLTLYAVFSALNLVAFIVHQGGNRATQLQLQEGSVDQ